MFLVFYFLLSRRSIFKQTYMYDYYRETQLDILKEREYNLNIRKFAK